MTETEEIVGGSEPYSRKSRRPGKRHRTRQDAPQLNTDFKENLLPARFLPALIWSVLASVLSVANPFLTGLANNLQTQNLYAGLAMAAGQNPYGDFFGTNGVLYYLLTYASALLKSNLGLAVFQFVALLIAGVYFYKIVAYFSKSRETADQLSTWFYLFIMALGFGGIYASLFALPFLLASIWFLVRYFENAVRDESFILYGMNAALVLLIDPKSLLLWVVAALVLLVFNVHRRQTARGIYQLLASFFGFLLVAYSVGYYTFIQQILGVAIQQTFFYHIGLTFTHASILWTLAIVGGALLVSGFLKNFFQTLFSFKGGTHGYIKFTLVLTFLVQLLFIIGHPSFEVSQLIVLLPYGFSMAVLPLKPTSSDRTVDPELEHDDSGNGSSQSLDYLKANFFLPLLVCLYIPLQPVLLYVQEGQVNQERTEIANYITEHSESDATIYAWDNSAKIYLESQRLSAARMITAAPYLTTEANQADLVFDLNKNEAQFIVVNQKVALLDTVKSNLERNYQAVDLGTTDLLLYQKN